VSAELYRIAFAFPEETLFLDIETTGLSRYYNKITLVGWSRGSSYEYWLRGTDPARLLAALADAQIIVTFNGTMFDLPFMLKGFLISFTSFAYRSAICSPPHRVVRRSEKGGSAARDRKNHRSSKGAR
jgi:hypothetical protein